MTAETPPNSPPRGRQRAKPKPVAQQAADAPDAPSGLSSGSETKAAQVEAMLKRPEGATGEQISEAMGWLPHTTRAFLSGLRKGGQPIQREDKVYRIPAPESAE